MKTNNNIQKLVLVALTMIGTLTQIGCGALTGDPELECHSDDTVMTQLNIIIDEISSDVIIYPQSDSRFFGDAKTLKIAIGGYGQNLYHGRNFLIGDFNEVNEPITVNVLNEVAFAEESQTWTGTISATLISTSEIPDPDQFQFYVDETATERKFEFSVDLQSDTSTLKFHGTTTVLQGERCHNPQAD